MVQDLGVSMIHSGSAGHNTGQTNLCMGAVPVAQGLSRTRTPQQHRLGFQSCSSACVTVALQHPIGSAKQGSCDMTLQIALP